MCAWQPGSLWPHHHCVSQPQPVQTCTLSCQPRCSLTHTHWVQVSCREGGKHQSWHICLNIVSDSLHLDLFVLKYPNRVIVFPNPMLFSKLAHWAFESRREQACDLKPPILIPVCNFCSSPVVLSVLCTLIGKMQVMNALCYWGGHFCQRNGYFETNQLQMRSILFVCPRWWSSTPSLVLFRFWRQAAKKKEKKIEAQISKRDAGWVLIQTCWVLWLWKKTKLIHVTDCTWS